MPKKNKNKKKKKAQSALPTTVELDEHWIPINRQNDVRTPSTAAQRDTRNQRALNRTQRRINAEAARDAELNRLSGYIDERAAERETNGEGTQLNSEPTHKKTR